MTEPAAAATATPAPRPADFEGLFEDAPCGFLCVSPDWHILRANQTFLRWTGHDADAITERAFIDLLDIAGRIYVNTHFAPMLSLQGRFDEVALNVVRADGSKMAALVNAVERRDDEGRLRMVLVSVFNATDRRRYEAELLTARNALRQSNATLERRVEEAVVERMSAEAALAHAQRLEAIGSLSAGVAHDFNNLLQVIGGNLQLLRKHVANERGRERIATALGGVERGAKLANQLLAFGRRQMLDARVHDIPDLLTTIARTTLATLAGEVELAVEIEPRDDGSDGSAAPLRATVDAAQLENAVLNLSMNARDAMRDGDGLAQGRLTVRVVRAVVGPAGIDGTATGRVGEGDYVALSVADTGTGMPANIAARVFDPFFTTKATGEGTGLGLSMVYGFATQSHGHVTVDSVEGQGTTITLWLPRTDAAVDSTQTAAPAPREGQGTVLVVEDDEAVRRVTSEMLNDLGYEVLQAADGVNALAVLAAGKPVDLMITDIVMPGPMHGVALAREASSRYPDLRIVLSTGYADAAARRDLAGQAKVVLRKPFSEAQLAQVVRDALAAAAPRPDAARSPAPTADPIAEPAPAAEPAKTNGVSTVLVVEDEVFIRMDLAEMLTDLGCKVEDVGSAEEALDRLGSARFDMLITDVGLEGTDGATLAREANRLDPAMHIAFATGQASPPDLPGIRSHMLAKPFTIEAITALLHEAATAS